MPSLEIVGKVVVAAGLLAVIVGGLLLLLARTGVGSLPGDFAFGKGNWKVYFPLGTSILVSVVVTVILSLLSRFR